MGAEINDTFKLALAQANPVVGDLTGNLETAWRLREEFAKAGADLVVFSELFLTGYPLEDLVLKPALQRAARAACEELAKRTGDGGPAILMGL
ncbi:MAG: nitrilase-related carbon-nitrogen hydrolase, partial [Pseudomonadota bacterium]